jgi:hypothetical protein
MGECKICMQNLYMYHLYAEFWGIGPVTCQVSDKQNDFDNADTFIDDAGWVGLATIKSQQCISYMYVFVYCIWTAVLLITDPIS